jgi:imidazoleglycerol phosphate synthase glutamine amidotransferase subunit HisH
MPTVHLLDYVAGNIRSLVNAIEKVGYTVEWVKSPEDVEKADVSHSIYGFYMVLALTATNRN